MQMDGEYQGMEKTIKHTKTAVILLAAGSGKRMHAGQNKLFLPLAGKPVLERTVAAFQQCDMVDGIVIVAKERELSQVQMMLPRTRFDKIIAYTVGGAERQDSVLCGLYALKAQDVCYDTVLIHDGARPFVTNTLIHDLLANLSPGCGSIAGVPAKDTIKRVADTGLVAETLVRNELWNIQTPQCFYTDEILYCYECAQRERYTGTDDASLAERYGLSVRVVLAYYENIKLTTPEDLDVAEVFWNRLHQNTLHTRE